MKISIKYRLFLAFLVATLTLVASMFLVTKLSFDRGFLRYINNVEQQRIEQLASELEQSFAENGSWDFLRYNPRAWRRLIFAAKPEINLEPPPFDKPVNPAGRFPERGPMPPPPPVSSNHFERRVLLLDAEQKRIFGPRRYSADLELLSLNAQGNTVGYLAIVPPRAPRDLIDPHQQQFFKKQRRSFAIIAIAMAGAAALLSVPLSRRLVRRITDLAAATHLLTAGQYQTRVQATASDELGQLARDFNSLALTLENNEQLRRQWVADISHELRTPLAVLRGEIEALQDGVRPQTPQSMSMLHGEVMHLSRLVEDLYQLALADIDALSCRKEPIDLSEILQQTADSFRGELVAHDVRLTCEFPAGKTVSMLGDDRRLRQLFSNLLENSLRYTDKGGELRIRMTTDGQRAVIHFEDTAPGVAEEKLERLFDRLYRVESSRSRNTGGAGLGLALCKTIVESHDGTIIARPSSLGGLRIEIDLPLKGIT
ncbi:hypothetical protein A7E78_06540 [Syntrophotalea acetylenivorans]|uniref:histidine kinase n=1 Tax=Syntrophotalea acetylenivorans TaxID=1842532 RepID=A0A1L3GNL9_9BACT|nr:ATP-binding protein [Syntrophotalea acetylenivorans]APG27527.1 hypothetical protein A7E78_06540 [Syntrophotalea acetylenivorans]